MRNKILGLACVGLVGWGAASLEAVRIRNLSTAAGPGPNVADQSAPVNTPVRSATAAQSPSPAQVAVIPAAATPAKELIGSYCLTCHNQRVAVNGVNAGLQLDKADSVNVANSAAIWEKVVEKLRTRTMPPPGNRRPDVATYDTVASWLEKELDREGAAHPNPGRTAIHRLNRAEYSNAIKDLLGVEVDTRELLPPDGSAFGFDNIADALSVTPGLMDRYLSAAVKLSRIAVGDPTIPAGFETYNGLKLFWQTDRRNENFPLGTRGGILVRHYFPVDGEYVLKLQLSRTYTDQIRGLTDENLIEIRVDGTRVAEFKIGGKFASVGGGRGGGQEFADYLRTGDKDLEVRLPMQAGAREVVANIVKTMAAEPEGLGPDTLPIWNYGYADNPNTQMGVASVLIGGPYNGTVPKASPSRARIFVCSPATASEESACATKILSTLARRAYRRPTTAKDVQTLMSFYQTGRAAGNFDAGIRSALEMILAHPDFLFRMEQEPTSVPRRMSSTPGRVVEAGVMAATRASQTPSVASAYRVNDIDMASRLSFFLWSSIPDEELMGLAERGKLKDPAVLKQQVARLLASPRAQESLLNNFFAQWLQIRNVWALTPDTGQKFPAFEDNLREAMEQETKLFLQDQLLEDRSAIELLTADYTFVNERLAKHYAIAGVYGSHFRRVTIEDPNRRGILGQASILSVTSYPNRTAPTIRGKWLLENILAAPMPPPPPNVPALEQSVGAKPTSVRETLELHRKNPVCASCHARMDPLGLSLENFDALGQWRMTDNGKPIDANTVLLDGTKINGPVQLRELLLSQKEQFAKAVTKKLLIYALGRNVEYYDGPAIRRIVRNAAAENYRWSSLISGVIESTPFQMRRPKS